jgi:hypothetical protein
VSFFATQPECSVLFKKYHDIKIAPKIALRPLIRSDDGRRWTSFREK